jgi:hypothetical protein
MKDDVNKQNARMERLSTPLALLRKGSFIWVAPFDRKSYHDSLVAGCRRQAGATASPKLWNRTDLDFPKRTLETSREPARFSIEIGPRGVPGGVAVDRIVYFAADCIMFETYDRGGLALLAVTIGGPLFWAAQSGEIRLLIPSLSEVAGVTSR